MAGTADVKSLLLEVDASVELLRRNLTRGDQAVGAFESETRARLDRMDRRFGQLGDGLRQLPTSVARARAEIGSLGVAAARAEAQVRASSGAMRTTLLASASAIAAAFSVGQIKEFADGYTRFTNQLKVAGLENAALGKTQNELFSIAQRYGVQLESLGGLYGRLSQGSKELGASQSDLMRFTTGIGAALKVQGGSAESTAGAIQQLTQALGGQIVRAEEFNSINEGARPILQAVANGITRFGGSVSKLRAEVIEGKVTSREFFNGFLKGSADLEKQAEKANLTIAASFTTLNNALGKYIGETDASLSATARFSGGIAALANNLDVVIPGLTTIAVAYGTVKGASLAFAATSGALASVAGVNRAIADEVLRGNASLVSRTALAARSAQAAATNAAVEVTQIQGTIAARQAEQALLRQQIVEERALAAERKAQAVNLASQMASGGNRTALLAAQRRAENDATFATQRLTVARQRLAVVDGELAVAEGGLAAAQTRSAAAANVAAVATTRATLAARAGEAASRLFAGALTLIGGSVAGGAAVLAIGALVGAILYYRNEATEATRRNREFAAASKEVNEFLAQTALIGRNAATSISGVGANAVTATGRMLTFAGAVGEAAAQLRQLAADRQKNDLAEIQSRYTAARQREREATAAYNARQPSGASVARGTGFVSPADQEQNRTDIRNAMAARSDAEALKREYMRVRAVPLESRLTSSERNGGRDVAGEQERLRRDLIIARRGTNKALVADLQAQQFELKQYAQYKKDGLSVEAAQAQAGKDAAAFRSATADTVAAANQKTSQRESARAARAAAAERRKEEAAVRDAAADARAYASAERTANNDIAAARADLTGSAEERANIERARIEGERANRNDEIETQGPTGAKRFTATQVKALQDKNDQRAALETQVVEAREKQRVADETLAIASAGRENQSDILRAQTNVATTLRERRDLELRLLDLQYEEEQARLDAVIASRESTDAQKKIAQDRKAILGELKAGDRRGVETDNASQMDQYRERIRRATSDMGEALDGVKANGLQNLEDGLLGIVTGTESVGSAFKKMTASIIADLARIALQKAILSVIGGGVLGFAEGGTIPGFASGGTLGGVIKGPGTGTSDSILALLDGPGGGAVRLSAGEGILTADALAHYGTGIVDRINAKQIPRFATGGLLNRSAPRAADLRAPGRPDVRGASARRDRVEVLTQVKVDAAPSLLIAMEETSIRTIGAAADPIAAMAESRTRKGLARQDLPGGLG